MQKFHLIINLLNCEPVIIFILKNIIFFSNLFINKKIVNKKLAVNLKKELYPIEFSNNRIMEEERKNEPNNEQYAVIIFLLRIR